MKYPIRLAKMQIPYKKIIQDHLLEHEAYQVNIESLISRIDKIISLVGKSPTSDEVNIIREKLQDLSFAFLHTKDILIRHEDLDMSIFKDLVEKSEMDDIDADHDTINKAIDQMYHELFNSDRWSITQIEENTIKLQKGLHDYQLFATTHIIKENRLLKRGLTN